MVTMTRGGAMTAEQQEQFEREGYVVARGLLDPERDLRPIETEFATVLDRLANDLYAAGRVTSTYVGLPFSDRFTKVCQESGEVHAQYFDCSLPQSGVKPDTPFWAGPAVFALLRNEGILNVIESLIGSEIYANPVQHVRLKPPEHLGPRDEAGRVKLGATPWHQDNGVVTEDADETDMITVWLPLGEATERNGCLKVLPGQHRGDILQHCPATAEMVAQGGFGLHIPERHLGGADQAIPLPMRSGDVLFMHRRTPHASLSNTSDHVRWSFDLRYNPIGAPTGRSAFPGFIARSRANPDAELRDPDAWTELWRSTRNRLAEQENPRFNRWDPNAEACA